MSAFKKCPMCYLEWSSRQSFLSDPKIKIIGYQVNFRDLELGLFLFNHGTCKTTLALEAHHFTDLYEGPILKERKTETESCPNYCLNTNELRTCPNKCECDYVRKVIHTVENWHKSEKVTGKIESIFNVKKLLWFVFG